MSLDNFIPQLWSARLIQQYQKASVYVQLCNRNWEGEIKAQGDSVRILTIGNPTMYDVTKNSDIPVPEVLQDSDTVLIIEKKRGFNFAIDDIDQAQAVTSVMEMAMQNAAYVVKDDTDTYVAAKMAAGVSSSNYVASSGAPKNDLGTAGKAYEYLVALGVELDEANVPSDGRWVVVPPWYYAKLLLDDRFVKAGTPATDQVLRDGKVGAAAGFEIWKSNNTVNDGTTYQIVAGTNDATGFADQMMKLEAYRPERRHSDAMKGLHLYGGKVIKPSGLALLYANSA